LKKAVLLHGTDGAPGHNWFPWLKAELEKHGYEVWVPELPNNHTPNRHTYNDFLFNSNWDFSDNLVIGHSSGAVSVLNLLEDERCPIIKTGVLIGVWARMEETDLDREQFKDLFPESGFKFDLIKQKTDNLLFLHGDDDPYCPLDQAKWLAEQTVSEIIVIPGGRHLSQGQGGFTELPQLTTALSERGWL
jgi:predicted alpha/beta hydrolase family esterase